MISRTINPIHFEDLEPHRFEDLVRQLVYTFREWHDLEATGRLGSDDGIDIRALERIRDLRADTLADEETESVAFHEREWRIQCKRERRIGPSKLEAIAESLLSDGSPPHGVMICAACDFSKASRDRFRTLMSAAGVEEFFLWGKAELEDRLFQAANDHLLWAYFGISIRVRRRSLRTELRSHLALKRQLSKLLGEPNETPERRTVFLRDAEAPNYPDPENGAGGAPRWEYYTFEGHVWPGLLGFVTGQYFASWDRDTGEYDFHPGVDLSPPDLYEVGVIHNSVDPEESNARNFWRARIPPHQRAMVKELSVIHYDQVLAIDDLGDVVNPGPHLFVDFEGRDTPFRRSRTFIVNDEFNASEQVPIDELTRVKVFPAKLPEVSWAEAQEAWKAG